MEAELTGEERKEKRGREEAGRQGGFMVGDLGGMKQEVTALSCGCGSPVSEM